jgi:hypothetical protein
MHQHLWGHKVEEKIYLGVRERERLNVSGVAHSPGSGASILGVRMVSCVNT